MNALRGGQLKPMTKSADNLVEYHWRFLTRVKSKRVYSRQFIPSGPRPSGPPGVAAPGFFFSWRDMVRVVFLVDGFNLYHSVLDAEKQLHQRLHWLDIAGMCGAQLSSIGQTVGRCEVGDIYYFSALAHHVESSRPGTVKRHQTYLWALKSTGVHVELAQFKEKDRWCPLCHRSSKSHEEKETDVALAVRLLELLVTRRLRGCRSGDG
jgi:hypothetical protein